MIPAIISASAFEKNLPACLDEILAFSHNTHEPQVILINHHAKLSKKSLDQTHIPYDLLHLSTLLHRQQKIKLKEKIKRLSAQDIIILDGRHHDHETITSALTQIAAIWFHLDCWQKAFVLVVDDWHCKQLAHEWYATFYLVPISTHTKRIQADVRFFHQQVFIVRFLGLGMLSRLIKRGYRYFQKWYRYVKKYIP